MPPAPYYFTLRHAYMFTYLHSATLPLTACWLRATRYAMFRYRCYADMPAFLLIFLRRC